MSRKCLRMTWINGRGRVVENKLIKQAFMEMADEMEQELGDWQSLPDTEADQKLRERIMAEARKIEDKK